MRLPFIFLLLLALLQLCCEDPCSPSDPIVFTFLPCDSTANMMHDSLLKVYGKGAEDTLFTQTRGVFTEQMELPLNMAKKETVFIFEYLDHHSDTVMITATFSTQYISQDCPAYRSADNLSIDEKRTTFRDASIYGNRYGGGWSMAGTRDDSTQYTLTVCH